MKRLALVLLMLLTCSAAFAQGTISQVKVVGPSWETFTNRDGTGLYHEILNKVFGLYDITVVREYVPSIRAYDLVREGKADFMTCHDSATLPLRLAKHPMFEGTYYVLYDKNRFPDWNGEDTLRGKTVAWRFGYYHQSNFAVDILPLEEQTGLDALAAVVSGEADFYVDDLRFIQESLEKATFVTAPAAYDIKPVGRRTYHPVFTSSERAQQVMKIYDQGMETLYRNGELCRIFRKWGHEMPHYDIAQEHASD